MSLKATIAGIARDRDGIRSVASTKIDLIRQGVVSSRGWGIADAAHARWTAWDGPPDELAAYSAAEVLAVRQVALLLNGYLHEDLPGDATQLSETFVALQGDRQAEAFARLHAATTGQLAASVLGVSALHNTSWIAADPAKVPFGAAHAPSYVGAQDLDPDAWFMVTSGSAPPAEPPHQRTAPDAQSGSVLRVAIGPGKTGGLDATLQGADGRAPSLPEVDRDRLEELRYGLFARTVAARAGRRSLIIEGPGAHTTPVWLYPLGVAGFLGISHRVADAIEEALLDRSPDAVGTFAEQVRDLRRRSAADNPIAGSPILQLRAHRTAVSFRTKPVSVDGLEYDVSIGRDGIALLLPSSVVRTQPLEVRAA